MQSLKNLAWTVSVKKPMIKFSANQENGPSSPLNMNENPKKSYIHDLLNTEQTYKVST